MIRWMAGFIGRHTSPCQQVAQRLSDAMDRRLPLHQQLDLRLHLVVCALCERYRRHLETLRRLMRDPRDVGEGWLPDVSLPPDVRERLKRVLNSS